MGGTVKIRDWLASEDDKAQLERDKLPGPDREVDELAERLEQLAIKDLRKVEGRHLVAVARAAARVPEKERAIGGARTWIALREAEVEDKAFRALGPDAAALFARAEAQYIATLSAAERVEEKQKRPDAMRERRRVFAEKYQQSESRAAAVQAPDATAHVVSTAHAAAAGDPIPEAARETIVRELQSAGLPTDDATVRAVWEEQ